MAQRTRAKPKILCTAHSKQTGKPCGRAPSKGKTVCNSHGAKSPSGIDSPHAKHLRYSKAIPERLMERFQASVDDPELLDLSREIAVMDARLHELLGRVDTGESGALWRALKKGFADWQAEKMKEKGDPRAAEKRLGELIERGFADNAAWTDVFEVFELRRVAVQTEEKRRQALHDTMSSKQAMALVAALIASVTRHVRDTNTLRAVRADIVAIVSHDTGERALPAGA